MSEGQAALFWGIISFSILILIHEAGHFAVARLFGLKVHEFMIGLPGPAIRIRGKKTTYGITAVPLGGYVRIAGMEPGPEDPRLGPVLSLLTERGPSDAQAVAGALGYTVDAAEVLLLTLADWDAVEPAGEDGLYRSRFSADETPDSVALLDRARRVTYRVLPTYKRVLLLSAGVIMNLVVAVAIFFVFVSAYGIHTTRISEISPASAAEKAGLRTGDVITHVAEKRTRSWQAVMDRIGEFDQGATVTVRAQRGEQVVEVRATLGKHPQTGKGMLGVSPSIEKPGPLPALAESVSYIGLTFVAVLKFFDPSTFRQAVSQSSSVIGASYMAADAARESAASWAALMALLSLSLGVLNIFPIPPLDGGKIALEVVEKLRGRPLSRRFSLSFSAVGAALLLSLIGYLMYNDVVRFIVG